MQTAYLSALFFNVFTLSYTSQRRHIKAAQPAIFQRDVLACVKMVVRKDISKGDRKTIAIKLFLALSYLVRGIDSPRKAKIPHSTKKSPPLTNRITIKYLTTKISETGIIRLLVSPMKKEEKASNPKTMPIIPIILLFIPGDRIEYIKVGK